MSQVQYTFNSIQDQPVEYAKLDWFFSWLIFQFYPRSTLSCWKWMKRRLRTFNSIQDQPGKYILYKVWRSNTFNSIQDQLRSFTNAAINEVPIFQFYPRSTNRDSMIWRRVLELPFNSIQDQPKSHLNYPRYFFYYIFQFYPRSTFFSFAEVLGPYVLSILSKINEL